MNYKMLFLLRFFKSNSFKSNWIQELKWDSQFSSEYCGPALRRQFQQVFALFFHCASVSKFVSEISLLFEAILHLDGDPHAIFVYFSTNTDKNIL